MIYECHGHIIADGISYQESMERHKNGVDKETVRRNLKKLAEQGIGFYRDGGDKYMVSAYAKSNAQEYEIDYRTPIFITHKAGYYGAMYGKSYETLKEFYALVREAKTLGADFIKLTVTGMLDFGDGGKIMGRVYSAGELKEAVRIASGEGFAVMAHVNGADNIKSALEAGVQSIEHGFWPDVSVIDYFVETNAVWVPTCATVQNILGSNRYDDSVLLKILHAQKEVLMAAFQRGVLIASGSDCGAWRVPQGSGTMDEYKILAGYGIDPEKGNRQIRERFKLN